MQCINKRLKKLLLALSATIMLSGNFGSFISTIVSASENNETEDVVTEAVVQDGLNSKDESINEVTREEVSREGSNEEDIQDEAPTDRVDGETKEVFLDGAEDSYSDMEKSYMDFLNSYDELTEEEIIENLDAFQLFIDDEDTIHSMIEVLEPKEFGASQNKDLVERLQFIREENKQKSVVNSLMTTPLEEVSNMNMMSVSSTANNTTVERIAGQNRMRVAENISRRGWSSSDTVIIANGYKFTDALSGTPLAAHHNAPMLLVSDKRIDSETLTEIARLKARNIIILGGPHSVPEHISNTLKNRGLNVRRIAGQNRYDTSRMIAEEVISLRGPSTAHLVNGDAYADAVSISTVAGRYKQPILLTRANELHPEVRKLTNTIKDWRIIVGTTSISNTDENQLKSRVSNATRLAGKDRYEVNKRVLNHWGISGRKVYIGSGTAFADILTGSILASRENSGVLLLDERDNNIQTAENYARNKGLNHFIILGGTNTLSNRINERFRDLYKSSKKIIYLDPGHGGIDSGPVYGGISEKTLNLSLARILRDYLVSSGKYEVVMSRNSDTFLTLEQRANDANARNADIFVSIHYNAMGGVNAGRARGIETFIHHRVSSGFGQETNRNAFLTSDPRIRDSLRLADQIHPRLISATKLNDRGIKGNNFGVLRMTKMPAVLVEYGFMDNATELSIIRTTQHQRIAAMATKNGIDSYFGF
ncbi:hypothetical protein IRB23M11_18720 [Alkalibacterium sp. m-11]|uniref:MurNAc-LAA domain-containing protein n=1 Tax=Alkalibacterium indicireducens TaxID=398758 RepID=A0ABP3L479_9LACT